MTIQELEVAVEVYPTDVSEWTREEVLDYKLWLWDEYVYMNRHISLEEGWDYM